MEQHAAYAVQAKEHHTDGNYAQALEILRKMQAEMGPDVDPKLLMNLAITEYASGHCQQPQQLLQKLVTISRGVEKKARAEAAPDKDGNDWRKQPSVAVLLYNQAVIHFQLKRYASAADILESIFAAIEPVDEAVAMRVVFLLLELYVVAARGCTASVFQHSDLHQKAMALIEFLEKPHEFNGKAPPSEVPQGKGRRNNDSNSSDKKAQNASVVEFRFRLHLAKAKLQLLKENVKQAKKEIKSALEIFQQEIKALAPGIKGSGSAGGAGNNSAAQSGTRALTPAGWWATAGSARNTTPLFLKANLEYRRGNYKKSMKLLNSCSRMGMGMEEALYLNGMGCIHYRLKLYRNSSFYFARALAVGASAMERRVKYGSKSGDFQDWAEHERRMPVDFLPEVHYNSGVVLLKSKRPGLAFRCFRRAALHLNHQPRIWLRLAECCIATCKARRKRQRLVRRVVGEGEQRRVLLCVSSNSSQAGKGGSGQWQKAAKAPGSSGAMSLAYAQKCLQNALLLLPPVGSAGGASSSSAASSGRKGRGGNNSNSSASEKKGKVDASLGLPLLEARQLLQSVLLGLAYVALCQGNPVQALCNARKLLSQQPPCSESSRRLAHVYAAEALSLLNRPADAQKMLNQSLSNAQSSGCSSKERAALYVNMANVHIFQGELARAEKCAHQALQAQFGLKEGVRLLVYIYLRRGNTTAASKLLQQQQVTTSKHSK